MELLVLLLPLRHVVQLLVYLMDGLGDVFQLSDGFTVGGIVFTTHPLEEAGDDSGGIDDNGIGCLTQA